MRRVALFFRNQYRPPAGALAQHALGILASIIVMWFSRQRELRAGAGGAQLAGRANMIAALRQAQ